MTDQLHLHAQKVNSFAEHMEQNKAHFSINTVFA